MCLLFNIKKYLGKALEFPEIFKKFVYKLNYVQIFSNIFCCYKNYKHRIIVPL